MARNYPYVREVQQPNVEGRPCIVCYEAGPYRAVIQITERRFTQVHVCSDHRELSAAELLKVRNA